MFITLLQTSTRECIIFFTVEAKELISSRQEFVPSGSAVFAPPSRVGAGKGMLFGVLNKSVPELRECELCMCVKVNAEAASRN